MGWHPKAGTPPIVALPKVIHEGVENFQTVRDAAEAYCGMGHWVLLGLDMWNPLLGPLFLVSERSMASNSKQHDYCTLF